LQIDSFFIKGQTHDICQDYALCGSIPEHKFSYMMISDGCSMISTESGPISHPISDFASRLVCLAAKSILKENVEKEGRLEISEVFFALLASNIKNTQAFLGCGSECADATLSMVTLKDGLAAIITIGDGVLVIEKSETIEIISRKYTPNFPAYVSYLTNLNKYKEYVAKNIKLEETKTVIDYNGNIISVDTKEIDSFITSIDSIQIINTINIKSISIFSDGIGAMVMEGRDEVPLEQAVLRMINIPNPCGQFVRRRLKATSRTQKIDIGPSDDLSMAMIRCYE
jgi:hypothetical protein